MLKKIKAFLGFIQETQCDIPALLNPVVNSAMTWIELNLAFHHGSYF